MSNPLPLIIAHRGASQDAPENTLAAFELAWQQEADGIEGDFHLTADGVIVCVHDFILYQAGQAWTVAECSLAALQQQFPAIPTLRQVLHTVPASKRMVIEVKCGAEIVPILLRDIEASGLLPEQIMVIAFDANVIAVLKQQAPDLMACWLTELERDVRGEWTPSPPVVVAQLQAIQANGVSTFAHPQLTHEWLQPIMKAGYPFHVWTVDEPDLARQMIALGVKSLTTNQPLALRRALGTP